MTDFYAAAQRLDHVNFSPVRKVLERANQLADEGMSILHLEMGEPDFDTPKAIVDATADALCVQKRTHYAPNRGVLKLRENISRMLKEQYHADYDGASEILLTCGAAESIFDVIMGIVNPKDEIIIMTPAYMNYENCINMAGAKCVKVELEESDGYQVNRDVLESAITAQTRMIVVTNPNNPTGTVLSKDSLNEIASIAKKYDLIVMADEIYAALTYGVEFTSFASLEGMRDRTIIVSGFSKCFAMTGWRVGYIAADARFIPSILKVHQYTTTCIPTFIQDGLADGMFADKTNEAVHAMVSTFDERRRLVTNVLDQIPEISYGKADGAFYVFANVGATGLDGTTFATRLLEEKGVAIVPGAAFGENCTDCVRISYSAASEILKESLQRIKDFVEGLRK